MSDREGAAVDHRIVDIVLDELTVGRRSAEVEHERAVAIYDLLEENRFKPSGCGSGPYRVVLSIEDNRLIFDIGTPDGQRLDRVPLPVLPFRKTVKEYFLICESYYDAIKHAPPSRIEAIDMGRRGLHNEGSELLRERLAGRIEIDHNTARRLFTLLCVLHIRS
ncbi:MAG: UPF0262 family protein [Inquilinus sp.]|nr:UPF0262 family protein [Inquilinus sp.]